MGSNPALDIFTMDTNVTGPGRPVRLDRPSIEPRPGLIKKTSFKIGLNLVLFLNRLGQARLNTGQAIGDICHSLQIASFSQNQKVEINNKFYVF